MIEKVQSASSAIQAHHIESILTVLVYIEAHLDEPLSLQKLAKIAHISPYYFHRLFHAYLSKPPREYIKHTRFTQSAKRLQYSHMSITDIAFAMGYENASSFTRAFFQLTGKSPRIYRRETWHRLHLLNPSIVSHRIISQPTYLYREEQTVFFRRKMGDYQVTVIEGIRDCQREMTLRKTRFLTCYGVALDDPSTVLRAMCRFDICVSASASIQYKGHWGQRKLAGGKYAVFTHCGPFSELEERFTSLFYLWHTSCKEKLRFTGAFCEYVDLSLDISISPSTEVTAKYYVPLLE